ncbi:MAG: MFS transporter [Proteobacteria bacterium]|jgi:MFS family permease|nr:MFS transporter [Pseudomonadota bacterium]MDA1299437.1 MFS transporter [Pseudomonadota bacterium]
MNELAPRQDSDVLPTGFWAKTFAAFRIANFRWFFAALCCNFASMNIQMFIRGWLVFEITHSYEKLGWMTAAGGIVGLIAAPLGGVIADRVPQKKTVLQAAGVANGIVTVVIAVLITRQMLQFEHLLAASVLQGFIMNGMMPSRQALTRDVVGLDLLTNAIGLSTSGMNAARLMLPGLAGGLVAALGGGDGNVDPAKWVYLMMTVLYFGAAAMMLKVRVIDHHPHDRHQDPVLIQIRAGFAYVLRTPVIFMLLGCNFLMVFFSMTYFMLLPGFVKEVLGAGPEKLGLIISVSGLGSLAGSLVIASLPNRNRARILLSGSLLAGIALMGFALSTNYWLSLVLLTIVGLGQSTRMSLSNVLIQSHVDDDYRGRVMSIYMLEMSVLSIAVYPISILADVLGPQWAVGGSAACLVVLILVLFKVPAYRNLD